MKAPNLDEGFINQERSKINHARHLGLIPVVEQEAVDHVAGAVKEQQFEIIQTNLSKE